MFAHVEWAAQGLVHQQLSVPGACCATVSHAAPPLLRVLATQHHHHTAWQVLELPEQTSQSFSPAHSQSQGPDDPCTWGGVQLIQQLL